MTLVSKKIFPVLFFIRICFTLSCKNITEIASILDAYTIVETSIKTLEGIWISEGCEIRPGPEYVIRSYTFLSNGSCHLVQHYYWDDSCSLPQITLILNGRLRLRNSLMQQGAASGTLQISNLTVIPQDYNATVELQRVASIECPGQISKIWRIYEEHLVYKSPYNHKRRGHFNLWLTSQIGHSINDGMENSGGIFSDINCLGSLKWAFNELKLLKIQMRPLVEMLEKKPKAVREVKMELLVGDIHTNSHLRPHYIPTSFQAPLAKYVKEPTAMLFTERKAYLIVKNAQTIPKTFFTNSRIPPHLFAKPHLPPYVWGEWVSTRCESKPMNLYLMRKLTFTLSSTEDRKWVGDHYFYADSFCRVPRFVVTASGTFNFASLNDRTKDATNIDFHIQRVNLTVRDTKAMYDIKLPGLCGRDEWLLNVANDLSTTGGCPHLGIVIPSIRRDIVKIEMDYDGSCLLYLGQSATDFFSASVDNVQFDLISNKQRPTAFQLPLMKCGEETDYFPEFKEMLKEQFRNMAYRKTEMIKILSLRGLMIFVFLYLK